MHCRSIKEYYFSQPAPHTWRVGLAKDLCIHSEVENEQGYISKILCPKIVLDSASTKYSLQTKLDRQYALIFILQQAMYLCEVLCKNYS